MSVGLLRSTLHLHPCHWSLIVVLFILFAFMNPEKNQLAACVFFFVKQKNISWPETEADWHIFPKKKKKKYNVEDLT